MIKSPEISEFLSERIIAGDFPSAVYLVAEKGKIVFEDAIGLAVVMPVQIEVRLDTVYDLASLTKALVTGLLIAKLMERGEIRLEDDIARHFPEFSGRGVTIRNLVTHSSGLPAWKPFYLLKNESTAVTRDTLPKVIAEQQADNPIDTRIVYSDLNFLLLTSLIEKLYGGRLDSIAAKEVFAPLGLIATFYNPQIELRPRIAASEKGNEFEKQTCIEAGFDVSKYRWREYQIWGEVHDGNTWFLDGVSGHAGLFSTAGETFRLAQQFLANSTRILKPETCSLFTANLTPNLNEGRSLGFQLALMKDSAGDKLPQNAFGHLGFTGTSLWIDPVKERVFILLTNRTHARELPFKNINSVRRRFHDTASNLLDQLS